MFPKKLSHKKTQQSGRFCVKLFLVVACMMLSFILGMLLSEMNDIDFAGIKRVVRTKVLPKISKRFEVPKEKKKQSTSEEKLATMQKAFKGMPWMKNLKKAQEAFKQKGIFQKAKIALDNSLRKKTPAQKAADGWVKAIKKYQDQQNPAKKSSSWLH